MTDNLSIEDYLASGPRPSADPAWIKARNMKPTGQLIGDAADMVDDEEDR